GDLVEHGVQVAGLLADVDHVDDDVVHQLALAHRTGDGIALADRLVDTLEHFLEDAVHRRLAHDRQRLQDRHAGAYERPQRAHGAGDDRLFDDHAHYGDLEFDLVENIRPRS